MLINSQLRNWPSAARLALPGRQAGRHSVAAPDRPAASAVRLRCRRTGLLNGGKYIDIRTIMRYSTQLR